MSFVATGDITDHTLTNDGWWPDIDTADLRATLRLDGTVTDARLNAAAVSAMRSTNRELRRFKAGHVAAGAAGLADVDADEINGESEFIGLYRRAVYCSAGAELVERYRNYDSTSSGHAEAEKLTESIDELRRDARWAIRDLLGVAHATVELI
jgi:hypothetical protein